MSAFIYGMLVIGSGIAMNIVGGDLKSVFIVTMLIGVSGCISEVIYGAEQHSRARLEQAIANVVSPPRDDYWTEKARREAPAQAQAASQPINHFHFYFGPQKKPATPAPVVDTAAVGERKISA
jgi:hypothetical protein